MIEMLFWSVNFAACVMLSWVSGCFLLRQDRPKVLQDWALTFGLLGVCVYGAGNALVPFRWDMVPNMFALMLRVSAACVAAVMFNRVFGWRVMLAKLARRPYCWAAWWRTHIEAGRELAERKQVRK